jgi:hypothetical protein
VIIDLYENINFDQNDTKSKLDHLQGLMKKIEVTMNEIKENQQDQHEQYKISNAEACKTT